jgi:hypothetical protein
MPCEEITHPEAIRLLRLVTAAGWSVDIRSSLSPFEVAAQRDRDVRSATGASIAEAICNLAEACGVNVKPAA